MFSDAISSTSWRCRPSSPQMAAAISGSASVRVAVKNESGAEVVFALEDEELMSEISPPPQPVTGIAVGHGWRSKAVLAGYHIGPKWPSACGMSVIFMQDMVGDARVLNLPPPCGGGSGVGVSRAELACGYPNPPPQGGYQIHTSGRARVAPYLM